MCEENRKRRIIFNFDNVCMTLETDYISEEECKKMVEKHAATYKVSTKRAFVFHLGTKDEDENGTLFFCPQCGQYNEYGWDPQVNQFYTQPKEGGATKPAGYYKYVPIDCDNCGVFEVVRDDFEQQMKTLSKEFDQHGDGRSIGTAENDYEGTSNH